MHQSAHFAIGKGDLFTSVCKKLESAGYLEDFMTFLNLIDSNKFPLNNISFLLFLDTVRFYGLSHSRQMTYPDQTKRFWKAGRNLFHDKFIYFMGGPKHVGQPTEHLTPDNAQINFAVPSVSVLNECSIDSLHIPKRLEPGCLLPILDKLNPNGDSYMLCADGKKVKKRIVHAKSIELVKFISSNHLNEAYL